jgi:hypothetical protein
MNAVIQLTQQLFQPIPAFNASEALAELGAETVKFSSFNDDEWYEFVTETLELVGRSSHYEKQPRVPAGYAAVKGIRAKWMGLWKYKEGTRSNQESRMEYVKKCRALPRLPL